MADAGRAALRVGALANVVAAAGLSAAFAFSQRLFGSADESVHLDYAYEVWKGRLPVFEHGLLIRPSFAHVPPVQWTAQHPPLYYLLEAPFVGPFLDANRMLAAGYAGRAVNVALACALVAAVMWAAAAIFPGRASLWIAAGAVTAANPLVVVVGGSIYNDNLFAVWATLLVGLTARMIRSGCTPKRLLLLALLASCALLTRSAAVVVVAVCAGTLGLVLLAQRPRPWRTVAGLAGAVLVAVAASSWFYVRNLRLTGNLVGGHFDYLDSRVPRPVLDVTLDPAVWKQLFAIYGYDVVGAVPASVLLVGVPVLVAAGAAVRRLARHRPSVPDMAVGALLCGLVAAVVAMQLQYVGKGGGASPRYMQPLVLVFSTAIAWTLTASARLRPYLLGAWLGLAYVPFVVYVERSLGTPSAHSTAPVYPAYAVAAVAIGGAALVVTVGVQAFLAGRRRTD